MQYLRARYYNPASGTFNRLDPFFGRLQDPQSLHKYLYVHGDPISGIDPSGLANLTALNVSIGIGIALLALAVGYQFTPRRFYSNVTHDWGVRKVNSVEGRPRRKIAIVFTMHTWGDYSMLAQYGANVHRLFDQLDKAGHDVSLTEYGEVTEDKLIGLMNKNEFVLLISHGIEVHTDANGDPLIAFVANGKSTHDDDFATPSEMLAPQQPHEGPINQSYISANELEQARMDGRLNSGGLEFIAPGCNLGSTGVLSSAIGADVFVANKKVKVDYGKVLHAGAYLVDRVNGLDRAAAARRYLEKNDTNVINPTGKDFPASYY